MRHITICTVVVGLLILAGCGQSYEETKRLSREQQKRLAREDSAALKIAVMPTLDCLPIFIAKDHQMFDTAVDIRLKRFTAQMDCDTALMRGRVEGAITDLVRAERIKKLGDSLTYFSATNAYWLLVSNRTARITQLKHLDDKMLSMTRYSATDLLADFVVDSAKLKSEQVFKIQVNDVYIRLKMLLNNEIDAVLLTEPQATQARLAHHHLMLDSRKIPLQLGVIAFREKALKDQKRQQQLDVFKRGYNQACDSLARYGVKKYRSLLVKYCKLKGSEVDSLPRDLKFQRIAEPQQADIERAQKWLKR